MLSLRRRRNRLKLGDSQTYPSCSCDKRILKYINDFSKIGDGNEEDTVGSRVGA